MQLPSRAPGPAGSWDFGKIPISPPGRTGPAHSAASLPGVIQRKLAIGRVDDPLEHEADRVADRVMRMRDPEISTTSAPLQIRVTSSADGTSCLDFAMTINSASLKNWTPFSVCCHVASLRAMLPVRMTAFSRGPMH